MRSLFLAASTTTIPAAEIPVVKPSLSIMMQYRVWNVISHRQEYRLTQGIMMIALINVQKKKKNLTITPQIQIEQYKIYWVKIRGYCMWPSMVERQTDLNRYTVHFFGDYTRSTVNRNSFLYNFVDGFVLYETIKSNNVKLYKAVAETSMYYAQAVRSNCKIDSCAVCTF